MITLFRTNRPIVFFYLMVYTLLLRGAFLYWPAEVQHGQDSFLAPYIMDFFRQYHVPLWVEQLGDILLTYISAVLLNLLLTAHNIFDRHTYVPAMIFITVSSVFGPWIAIHLQTVAQLFLMISVYNLFTLTGKELSRDNIFFTALYLSIGSLFYFPVALFLPVILITLVLRGYSFLDLMLALVGFVLPYFFIGIGYYYQDGLYAYLHHLERVFYPAPLLRLDLEVLQIGMLAYLVILSVLGYLKMASDTDLKVVKQRRLMYIVLGLLVIIIAATPFATGDRLVYLQMLCVPTAIFIARFFNAGRLGIARNILFALLLLGVVFFQLYYFKIL